MSGVQVVNVHDLCHLDYVRYSTPVSSPDHEQLQEHAVLHQDSSQCIKGLLGELAKILTNRPTLCL